MGQPSAALYAFNRGRISPLALARIDFKRTALSADVQTNWMPRKLGSMMLRPGWEYIGTTEGYAAGINIPFVFARADTALIEVTENLVRIRVDDTPISRPAVTTAVTNGTFASDISGWSDQDAGSAASTWHSSGYMQLVGDGNAAAKRRQQATVAADDLGKVHALKVTVFRGPVYIRVGNVAGGDQYIEETVLQTGYHNLAFTPSGDFHIDLFAYRKYAALVDSITVAAAGAMELIAPWAEADLNSIRWDQSGDVLFLACAGYRQRRLERRNNDSWSLVLYECDDGPFMVDNTGPITITPSGTSGDINLTASAALFRSGHVGALFRLTHTGQTVSESITAANQFSDPIRVTGVDGTRVFSVTIDGTFSATVTLQYSVGSPGAWIDAPSGTWTAPDAVSYDDTLDNQVYYYRVGVKTAAYTSGTVEVSLVYSSGTQTGIARVTAYSSATVVAAAVLTEFSAADATDEWAESYWSEYRGYPSAVGFGEGRLWWVGKDRVQGSISDAFHSYDDTFEGDAGPINRSIGSGPVDTIHWLVSGQRLLLGADGAIWVPRSSSFDEPLAPLNFNLKNPIDEGAAPVAALKVGKSAHYVGAGGVRVFEALYDGGELDYSEQELTAHIPEICEPGVVCAAVQRRPETREHFVKSDGTVAVMVYDKNEEVNCWIDIETDGEVENVCVLPEGAEDAVYYIVKRTIDGSEVRYIEKWALESECIGGTLNKQADSFVTGAGAVTGLDHLEGEEVVVWADGVDQGTFTVESGAISGTYTAWIAGLAYEARYKSTKLARSETDLCENKQIKRSAIIAQNLHPLGLEIGQDFDNMEGLPLTERYDDVDPDAVWSSYDAESFPLPGEWSTDSRLCLRAAAPRPATVLAVVLEIA